MSKSEDKSVQVSFRCPTEHYTPLQIILGQGLDPRVRTISDACNLGIVMYQESVEEYVRRPDVRKAIALQKAIAEAQFRENIVEMQFKLQGMSRRVGNGAMASAFDNAEADVKLFLPDGYGG